MIKQLEMLGDEEGGLRGLSLQGGGMRKMVPTEWDEWGLDDDG